MTSQSLQQFPFSNIYQSENLNIVGEGSYGKVFKSKNILNSQPVAIKQICMKKIGQESLEESLKTEIKLMKQLKSEFVVNLLDSSLGLKYSYLILQLCDGDLRHRIQDLKFNEEKCIEIFGKIMKGYKILVQNSFIHRDIKPENILIKGLEYKIGDLGFAMKADMYGKNRYNDFCGTPIYMAPQLVHCEPYTSKCDIWSLGLMLYEMLYGCLPWSARSLVNYETAIKLRPLAFPFNIKVGKETKDFIRRALVVEEENRMSWEEVFNHPLVKDKIAGEVILSRQVQPKVRLILCKMQTETNRKFVNYIEVFKKYESLQTLAFGQFSKLLQQLNPTITSYQINIIFQACDKNNNKLVERTEFQEMFCTVNYQMDYLDSREIDELVGIILSKKIELSDLFEEFDKNKTGALDTRQFQKMILSIAPKYDQRGISRLYRLLDKNDSKVIERKEFLKIIGEGLVSQKNYMGVWMEKAERNLKMLKIHLAQLNLTPYSVVKMADMDFDRHIDKKQFKNLMNKIKFVISEQQITDIFKMIDLNGSEKLSMAELSDYMN